MGGETVLKQSAGNSQKPLILKSFDLEKLRSLPIDVNTVSMNDQWFGRHINPDGSQGGFVSIDARIASNVFITPRSIVLHNASIGSGSRLLHESTIDPNVKIRDNVIVGTHSTIHRDAIIGPNSVIGPYTDMDKEAVLVSDVIIEGGDAKEIVRIGRRAKLETRVIVSKGASVEDNQVVPAGTTIEKSIEPEILLDLRRVEG